MRTSPFEQKIGTLRTNTILKGIKCHFYMDRREVAALANCIACDSYFLFTCATVPKSSQARGREGREELEELLLKLQAR